MTTKELAQAACPDWLVPLLGRAMEELLANRTLYAPGTHREQIDGWPVVLEVPRSPGQPFRVSAEDAFGKSWEIEADYLTIISRKHQNGKPSEI